MSKNSTTKFLAGLSAVVVPAVLGALLYNRLKPDRSTQKGNNASDCGADTDAAANAEAGAKKEVCVLYGTTTGTARTFAERMCQRINANPLLQESYHASVADLAVYNYEDELPKQTLVFLVCSTWSEGTPPESCRGFFDWLRDFA